MAEQNDNLSAQARANDEGGTPCAPASRELMSGTVGSGGNAAPATAGVSPFRLGLRRLRRNRWAITAVAVLAMFFAMALFADFLAPYSYDSDVRLTSHAPPELNFRDNAGGFHWRPFVYRRWFRLNPVTHETVWRHDRSERYPVVLFARGQEHRFLWLIPTRVHLFGLGAPVPETAPPAAVEELSTTGLSPMEKMLAGQINVIIPKSEAEARVNIFGADLRGRDIFSRICYGARISMSIGIVGAAITFILGMLIGGISGYFGGKIDFTVQRLCEMVMMIPGFYLMLALRSALPLSLPPSEIYLLLVVIMSLIGWAGFSRVIRGLTLSLRSSDYVVAATAAGAGHARIIVRHVLPNTLSYAIIAVTMSIPGYIIGESGLSLIGLGIQDPQASWGNMLADVVDNIGNISDQPWTLIPGIFIFLTIVAYNTLGDGLRDAFDPHGLTRQGML
jgi:peptide/nickel transport system permease protein